VRSKIPVAPSFLESPYFVLLWRASFINFARRSDTCSMSSSFPDAMSPEQHRPMLTFLSAEFFFMGLSFESYPPRGPTSIIAGYELDILASRSHLVCVVFGRSVDGMISCGLFSPVRVISVVIFVA